MSVKQMITSWFLRGAANLLVTFVYAKCNQVERYDLWNSLKEVCIDGPWMVVGDFNISRKDQERMGGNL